MNGYGNPFAAPIPNDHDMNARMMERSEYNDGDPAKALEFHTPRSRGPWHVGAKLYPPK